MLGLIALLRISKKESQYKAGTVKGSLVFKIGVIISLSSTVLSIIVSEAAYFYFFGLLLMAYGFIVGYKQNTTKTVMEIIVISLLISWIPLIKSVVPVIGLRHMYAADYIAKDGFVPPYYPIWRSNVYNLWCSSYILFASLQLLTGMSVETIYTFFLPIIGTLEVFVFYFMIKEITSENQIAAFSTLILMSIRNLLPFRTFLGPDALAWLFVFIALYSLVRSTKMKNRQSSARRFVIITILMSLILVTTHHLTAYLFIIMAVPFMFSFFVGKNRKAENRVPVRTLFFALFVLINLTWWVFMTGPFFEELTSQSVRAFSRFFSEGASFHWSYVALYQMDLPFRVLSWERLANISSIIFYVFGLGAFCWSLLKWRRTALGAFPWVVVLLAGHYAVIALTPLGTFLDPHRFVIFAAIPIAVLVASWMVEAIRRLPKLSIIFQMVLLFLVVTQIATAYSLTVYGISTDPDPFIYRDNDRSAGQWTREYTSNSSFFLGDAFTARVLLYGGHRECAWVGKRLDNLFRNSSIDLARSVLFEPFILHNPAAGTDELVYSDYLLLNAYNVRYEVYSEWGFYYPIHKSSVAANVNTLVIVDLVYDDGESCIYHILK